MKPKVGRNSTPERGEGVKGEIFHFIGFKVFLRRSLKTFIHSQKFLTQIKEHPIVRLGPIHSGKFDSKSSRNQNYQKLERPERKIPEIKLPAAETTQSTRNPKYRKAKIPEI